MATAKITLDKRSDHKTANGRCSLVLRIGHKRKTRDIPFDIHLRNDQFDPGTGKISGILNSVRHSKRTQKILSDVDLWLDENASMVKLLPIEKLKSEIEKKFFNQQPALTLLNYAGKYLHRLIKQDQGSTASSYEDALKAFVKYNMKRSGKDDKEKIKTLYEKIDRNDPEIGLKVLPEYQPYDMAIKIVDAEYVKDFRAHMSDRYSRNTVGMHLRSLNAIMNDAGSSFPQLKDHRPLSSVKKGSYQNAPNPWTVQEIHLLRQLDLEKGSSGFHVQNFFLFMFNNMGMNFFDIALIKCFQFDGERIKYFRKKTRYEGDYFSILQNKESLSIIKHYIEGKEPDDYLFPILNKTVPPERIRRVKNDKVGWFNKWLTKLAGKAEIKKKGTSYTPRDSWTNIGLNMDIDIRKISSGLGHSCISVTDKHYGQKIMEKVLDEINTKITEAEPLTETPAKEVVIKES